MSVLRILVVGGSGYVGARLVPFLLAQGHQVRVMGRTKETFSRRPWCQSPGVEIFSADVFDRDSLRRACDGCSAAYYLVHSMNSRQKDFAGADRRAAENMIEAAGGAGLQRMVYLSGLGDKQDALSEHLRSRAEVARILHSGSVPVTTLRAAMIIGTGSASFEILRYLVERLPVMITPRWLSTESQPIAIRNVLGYLAGCLQQPQTAGQTCDIGGPDVLTYQQAMAIFAQEVHLFKRLIIPVPVLTPRLSSYWINLVTPIPAAIAHPLAEGLRNRVVCQESRIRSLIAQDLISCRQAIRLALGLERLDGPGTPDGKGGVPPVEWFYPGDPFWVHRRKGEQ